MGGGSTFDGTCGASGMAVTGDLLRDCLGIAHALVHALVHALIHTLALICASVAGVVHVGVNTGIDLIQQVGFVRASIC